MALFTFDPTEIEDGTGKSTALVFEQPDDTATWLTDRGFPSFAAGNEASSKAASLNGTRKVLAAMVPFWRGQRRNDDQALLLPSRGAYRKDRSLIKTDSIPEDFLEGVRIAIEKQHAGTLYSGVNGQEVASESSARGSISYRSGSARAIVDDAEVWELISLVCPPVWSL